MSINKIKFIELKLQNTLKIDNKLESFRETLIKQKLILNKNLVNEFFFNINNSNSFLNIIFIGTLENLIKIIENQILLKRNENKKFIFILFEKLESFENLIKKIEFINDSIKINYFIINEKNLSNYNEYFYDSDVILLYSNYLYQVINFLDNIKFPSCNIFIFQDLYQNINIIKPFYDEILALINKKKINLETAKKFGKKWIFNILKNRIHYLKNPNISVLKNIGKNLPSIIIGAGNSLYKNLDLIKKIKNYFIIIAVDTAFRVLVKGGIIPDFIVSFDAQSINNSYVLSIQEKIPEENLPICIVPPTINPIFIKKYKGVIIFSSIFFHPVPLFDLFKNEKCFELSSGGTVTSAAYDLANFIDSSTKYIIGLDLCYNDNLLHSKNCLYEDIFYYIQNYHKTYIDIITKTMLKNHTFISNNLKGEKIRTDVKFEMFCYWFANYIDKNTFFLTEEVLYNDKFKFKSYLEFLSEDNLLNSLKIKKSIFLKKIQKIKRDSLKYESNYNKIKFDEYMKNLIKDFNEIKVLTNNIIYLYERIFYNKKNNLNIDSILLQLNFLEEKIKEYSEGFNILNLTIQKEILDIEFLKFENNEEFLKSSINFYKNIYKNLDKILYILEN